MPRLGSVWLDRVWRVPNWMRPSMVAWMFEAEISARAAWRSASGVADCIG